MTTIASLDPYLSRMALTSLSAQAGPLGARAEISQTNVQIGSTRTTAGRYELAAIAGSGRTVQGADPGKTTDAGKYQEATAADQRKREATDRRVKWHTKRAESMSIAMRRLSMGPLQSGTRFLALFSRTSSNAISIYTTGRLEGVQLQGGDQALAIKAYSVSNVFTGGGNDAITIDADKVSDICTEQIETADADCGGRGEATNLGYSESASNDAVAITARMWAINIYTGGGTDAIAVQGEIVSGIDAGSGNDAIAVQGWLISDVDGGDGNDTISAMAETSEPLTAVRETMQLPSTPASGTLRTTS